MIIDCHGCQMQNTTTCDDCVVSVLLSELPQAPLELAAEEADALENLAAEGLVPHLRLTERRRSAG